MSAEKLTTPVTTDISLSPSIKWYKNLTFYLIFKRSCSKQKNATFTPPNIINIFIVYELDTWSRDLNSDFTVKDCLFGGVKFSKNADPDKYAYTGCGVGFNSRSESSLPDSSVGKNVIIFGVDMSSYMYTDDKNYMLILDIGPIQRLDDTALTTKGQYSVNFSRSNKNFSLNLHYNRSNSFLSVNATKIYQCKAKDSEIRKYPLCLGNISGHFSANNINNKKNNKKQTNKKKTQNKYAWTIFLLITIIDIDEYLMKRHDMK